MAKKEFVRDKRSPTPKDSNVSKVMSANRAKNTKPEIAFRKLLWDNGLRGYRNNHKDLPGKPDVAFTKSKVAIFINGCYWHRCPHCMLSMPKNNAEFWVNKFRKNIERDAKKIMELENLNWDVITIWECELKNKQEEIIDRIKNRISVNID